MTIQEADYIDELVEQEGYLNWLENRKEPELTTIQTHFDFDEELPF